MVRRARNQKYLRALVRRSPGINSASIMSKSAAAAYDRFRKSMGISYEQWHDGIGYDLDAFVSMTPAERDAIAAEICSRPTLDWRDMEILRVHNDPQSFDRLRHALAAGGLEERAYAISELIKTGRMAGSVPD